MVTCIIPTPGSKPFTRSETFTDNGDAEVNFGFNSPSFVSWKGREDAVREKFILLILHAAIRGELLRHRIGSAKRFEPWSRVSHVRGHQRIEVPLVKFLEHRTISAICKQPRKKERRRRSERRCPASLECIQEQLFPAR